MIGAILIAATLTVAGGTASLVSWLNRRDARAYATWYEATTGEQPPGY